MKPSAFLAGAFVSIAACRNAPVGHDGAATAPALRAVASASTTSAPTDAAPPLPTATLSTATSGTVAPGALLDAEDAEKQLAQLAGRTIRVRGRYVQSTIEAGFPIVFFVGMGADAKNLGDDDVTNLLVKVKADDATSLYVCRAEFEPGVEGERFPRNAVIVASGVAGTDASYRRAKLALSSCQVSRK